MAWRVVDPPSGRDSVARACRVGPRSGPTNRLKLHGGTAARTHPTARCVWTLPEGDANYSTRWQSIKTGFSRQVPHGEPRSASRVAKKERGIWQRRFWEHTIRDEEEYRAYCDYIHFNPVKHGLVNDPADWPYSTYHARSRIS